MGKLNWSVLRNELERLARDAMQIASSELKEIADRKSPNPPADPAAIFSSYGLSLGRL
jgi:hypothetical protein